MDGMGRMRSSSAEIEEWVMLKIVDWVEWSIRSLKDVQE